MNLALWLKRSGFRADQVQTFYPSPMATATAMYHSGRNPLKGLSRDPAKPELMAKVDIVRSEKRRRLHKAFLKYHDAKNWPLLREALTAMGRADLIGNGKRHLIPSFQPGGTVAVVRGPVGKPALGKSAASAKAAPPPPARAATPRKGVLLTQHTGLPPRQTGAARGAQSAPTRPGTRPPTTGRKAR